MARLLARSRLKQLLEFLALLVVHRRGRFRDPSKLLVKLVAKRGQKRNLLEFVAQFLVRRAGRRIGRVQLRARRKLERATV